MPPEWSLSLKIKLTDIAVRSIKPNPAARIELSDTERSGLRFRMSPKGNASWLYQKKIKGGARRGFKLGSYPAIYRPSPKKPDRTSPIRARAPEVFKDGSRSAINFVLTAFIDN
jgi:hypothetical protein